MNIFKRLPLSYCGELHRPLLINFSVDMRELKGLVPPQIQVRDFNGRALISLVNVDLWNMRPLPLAGPLQFNYRHVALRLLVSNGSDENDRHRGIYFLRSFAARPWIVRTGRLLTEYKLERAAIRHRTSSLDVFALSGYIRYRLGRVQSAQSASTALQPVIAALDRAYSVIGSRLCVTRIQRNAWPLQPVECLAFETSFFSTARLEAAFQVPAVIQYTWQPPREEKSCA